MEKIFVTGCCGFIGFHLTRSLIKLGEQTIGLDNLNDYYDIDLKKSRLKELNELNNKKESKFHFLKGNLEDDVFINNIFEKYKPTKVVHLAAQAGVRYSITNPKAYINSNIVGFSNILENCRNNKVENFLYSSSSSVYGGNMKFPFNENDPVNHPVSLYAATKRCNELMVHSYSHLYNIPAIGMRFFTVYGPWGRPDMAPMIFTKAIFEGEPIKIFNKGNMFRDFTYIEDVIRIIIGLLGKAATPDENFSKENPNPSTSWAPHRIFNIGNSQSVPLCDFINKLEDIIGIEAVKEFVEMQAGDVPKTSADTKAVEEWIGFKPNTSIDVGLKEFVDWYKEYNHLN